MSALTSTTNPILADFRSVAAEHPLAVGGLATSWVELMTDGEDPDMANYYVWAPLRDLTREQIDHAAKVLTRLRTSQDRRTDV